MTFNFTGDDILNAINDYYRRNYQKNKNEKITTFLTHDKLNGFHATIKVVEVIEE